MTTLCSNCASEIPDGFPSCAACGTKIGAVAPAQLTTPLFSTVEDMEGLSGWLVLVGIGLVVSPFVMLYTILTVNLPFLADHRYQPYLSSHPAFAALAIFEVITNIIFITSVLALAYLFFTKRKAFPTFMILYLATQCCVIVFDTVTVHVLVPSANLSTSYASVARSLIGALVWIPYFVVSQRVKATFVR
ncbi:MAG: DUF2569 family protein [Terracidiphilus sp.]|nr:DUF2569 family protein [Terracidiphilus sp.]MDR3777233.1 DUF2569 family protein [Terracidiphilus sp.]